MPPRSNRRRSANRQRSVNRPRSNRQRPSRVLAERLRKTRSRKTQTRSTQRNGHKFQGTMYTSVDTSFPQILVDLLDQHYIEDKHIMLDEGGEDFDADESPEICAMDQFIKYVKERVLSEGGRLANVHFLYIFNKLGIEESDRPSAKKMLLNLTKTIEHFRVKECITFPEHVTKPVIAKFEQLIKMAKTKKQKKKSIT